jgi:hypothetical protein
MFLLLGLAVASSWRASTAPDWYWVLTSAVVSAMVVAVVVLYVAYLIKCPAAYFSLRRNR